MKNTKKWKLKHKETKTKVEVIRNQIFKWQKKIAKSFISRIQRLTR